MFFLKALRNLCAYLTSGIPIFSPRKWGFLPKMRSRIILSRASHSRRASLVLTHLPARNGATTATASIPLASARYSALASWSACEITASESQPNISFARTTESSVLNPAKSRMILPSGTPCAISESLIAVGSSYSLIWLSPLAMNLNVGTPTKLYYTVIANRIALPPHIYVLEMNLIQILRALNR